MACKKSCCRENSSKWLTDRCFSDILFIELILGTQCKSVTAPATVRRILPVFDGNTPLRDFPWEGDRWERISSQDTRSVRLICAFGGKECKKHTTGT